MTAARVSRAVAETTEFTAARLTEMVAVVSSSPKYTPAIMPSPVNSSAFKSQWGFTKAIDRTS